MSIASSRKPPEGKGKPDASRTRVPGAVRRPSPVGGVPRGESPAERADRSNLRDRGPSVEPPRPEGFALPANSGQKIGLRRSKNSTTPRIVGWCGLCRWRGRRVDRRTHRAALTAGLEDRAALAAHELGADLERLALADRAAAGAHERRAYAARPVRPSRRAGCASPAADGADARRHDRDGDHEERVGHARGPSTGGEPPATGGRACHVRGHANLTPRRSRAAAGG